MTPPSKTPAPLLLALWLLVTVTLRADAYTDPGSGALIWQTLMAAGFGILFYFRRAADWFRSSRKQSSEGDAGSDRE